MLEKKKMAGMIKDLKEQGVAVLVMVGIAILSVVGMIILAQFQASAPNTTASPSINTTIGLFIAAFALTGTFASVIMLIIIVKALIGVVGSLQSKKE